MTRIGLALGGGGAKGLAHIRILETLDEQLFARAEEDSRPVFDLFKRFRRMLDLIDLDFGSGGFIRGEKFMQVLYEDVRARSFEELETPLKVVATEFWSREPVVFESGELLPAVRASMSLPVLFAPVVIGERVLMDGGAVNPLPYDVLPNDCDVTIAVDVSGARSKHPDERIPTLSESVFNTFQIMSKAAVDQKLRLRPDLVDVQVLEFDKAHVIFEQADSACEALREQLAPLLPSP